MHEVNRRHWEVSAPGYQALAEADGAWRRCPQEPEVAFEGRALETIRECVGDLAGKKVCVVASGDNYAAFALAGLGAEVISTDISQRQLDRAACRAAELGLKMRFVQADAADPGALPEGGFDLVISTNGLLVWISDLSLVYGQIARLLRPGGHYVFYDVHPFQRPRKDQVQPLEMEKPYADTMLPYLEDENPSYQFHWTMAGIINALVQSGLSPCKIIESSAVNARFWEGFSYGPGKDESLQDWRHNPRAGLPVWLTVAAERE